MRTPGAFAGSIGRTINIADVIRQTDDANNSAYRKIILLDRNCGADDKKFVEESRDTVDIGADMHMGATGGDSGREYAGIQWGCPVEFTFWGSSDRAVWIFPVRE